MSDSIRPDDPEASKEWELASAQRYKAYFQLAPYGILIMDGAGKLLEVNAALAHYLGYSVEELLRMGVPDLVHAEHRDAARERIQLLVESGSVERTIRMRNSRGEMVWVDVKAGRLGPNRYIAFVRDVTDRMEAQQKALEAQTQFKTISGAMRDFIAQVDALGRYTYVSPSYETYLGLSSAQMLGRWALERVHPSDQKPLRSQVRAAAVGEADIDIAYRFLDGFGGWRWVESKACALRDPDGNLTGYVISSRDVTDRYEALQAGQYTEGTLRAFLDSIPDLAFIKDENLNNIFLNVAYLKFLGKTAEEVVGKPDSELIAAPWATQCRSSDLRAMETGTTVVEDEYSGGLAYETTKFPVVLGSGKIGLGGIIRNVTARRRLRTELEHRLQALTDPPAANENLLFSDLFDLTTAQALMDGLSDALGVASLLTDPSGNPITRGIVPPPICRLLKRSNVVCDGACSRASSPSETDADSQHPVIHQCSWARLMHATTPISVADKVVAYWTVGWVVDKGDSNSEQLRTALNLGLDESAYRAALRETPAMPRVRFSAVLEFVRTLAGQLSQSALRNLQQARHIEQTRRAEADQRRLEEQLKHAQKMEAIGRLAGGIAHDFGNLLTTIVGNLALAQMETAVDSPVQEYLLEIQKASQRAETLTRQVLAFSRKQVIDFKVINLNEILSSVSRLLMRLVGEDIEMKLDLEPKLRAVLADPGQVEQIIANLVVNARDAMPHGGLLTLRTSNESLSKDLVVEGWKVPAGNYVLLEVADNGAGMSDEVKKHLFEPFFTTKPKDKGTGLGLAIIYGAVQQHRGYVLIDSAVGKGTSIRIYLPRVDEQPETALGVAEGELIQGSETVLFVDDDASVVLAAAKVLQRLGYTVYSETTPAKALEFARDYPGPLHAVISDVVMPEMSGDELCGRIKLLRPEVSILLTSGHTDNRLAQGFVTGERIQFLPKPYSFAALTAALRSVLLTTDGRKEPLA